MVVAAAARGHVQLIRLRMCGFRSAGPAAVEVTFEKLTFLLGTNGTGKTALLHALARMFGSEPHMRRTCPATSTGRTARHPARAPPAAFGWRPTLPSPNPLEARTPPPTVPPNFAHIRMETDIGQPTVRYRLTAEFDEDNEITEEFVHALPVGADDEPTRTAAVNRFERAVIQVHYLPAGTRRPRVLRGDDLARPTVARRRRGNRAAGTHDPSAARRK